MAYRDQLKASRARVSNLEAQVVELEGEITKHEHRAAEQAKETVSWSELQLTREIGRLKKESRAKIDELENQLSEKQPEVERLRRRCEHLEKELARKGDADVPSLVEYNRRRPDLDIGGGIGAGDAAVHCPQCMQYGDRVKLRHAAIPLGAMDEELGSVLCPRCAYFGLLQR